MHKRLTNNIRGAINRLQNNMGEQDLSRIDSIFLLKEIRKCKGCLGKIILDSFNIKASDLKPSMRKDTAISKALSGAAKIAYSSKSPYIGSEHVVQSILSMSEYAHLAITEKDTASPLVKIVGIDSKNIKRGDSAGSQSFDYFGEISSMIEQYFSPENHSKGKKKSILENYCTNLNDISVKNHAIIGREAELERVSHILGRKMKNNPVLIGEPGVGKTAIVEGLAQNIRNGTAPYYLSDKRIMSLDLGLLIAGTTFRGEFESRLKDIITEVKRNPDIILFIDEIHNLVGAGNAIGGMDAANLLKPALSRGEIQVIGATTIDEYQKHIEKDAALERRFQPIMVDEPSVDEATKILLGIKPHYEKYHNAKIVDDSCATAAKLAKRYITDRFLPDSAIDLIDETSARLRSNLSDNSIYQKVKKVQQKKRDLVQEKEYLVMNDHYEEAMRIRQKEKEIDLLLRKLNKELHQFETKNPTVITSDDIRRTLSTTSRIPEQLLLGQDKLIAKNVKESLSKNLVGQPHVSKKISDSVLRQISGISSPHRPLGSFLFVGPTGVGKTHAAKLLSKAISLDDSDSLIHINMSEFMERHTASRLLGAPAGYVGYEDGNELTDKIRRRPYSVVLFDEIEKAEPSVLNILLQILEEGELTDSKGRKINFRNTIIALTSNIGAEDLGKISELGFERRSRKVKEEKEKITQSILEELHDILSPEFINRLDDVLIFEHLQQKEISKIISLEIKDLKNRLLEKGVELEISPETLAHIVEKAFNPKQGARLVRKTLQELVEPKIASLLIGKKKLKKIKIDLNKNSLVVQGK